MLKYYLILGGFVCRQNEGSFGCEAVARALGQPNVPECAVGFLFLCLYAAKILLSFCRLFLSFYNERQRLAVWLVADFEALSCQVTTTFDTGCAARILTAPAINYTACCAFGFYLFHLLIVN